MRELLPDFDGKFKVGRRPFCPALSGFRRARTVESGINFDGIEITRVELQLIGFCKRVEDPGPRAGTGVRRVAPAASPDTPDAGVIGWIVEELRQSVCL